MDGLDEGTEAGASAGAGAASEVGAGWVSGTDSSLGLFMKTDGVLSVGSLMTRVGNGLEALDF